MAMLVYSCPHHVTDQHDPQCAAAADTDKRLDDAPGDCAYTTHVRGA